MPRRAVSLLLLAALLGAAWAPAALAVTSTPAPLIKNPELFEQSLEVARRAVDQYGLYDDKAELARINRIGYRVAQESRFVDFPFTFHAVDMPEPNAFALPGGHIFVTRGMLELGLDDDMLACLLGHEIGHVVFNHYAKMQKRQTLLSVLGQALMVGVMISAKDSGGTYDPKNPIESVGRAQDRADTIQGAAAASLIIPQLLLRSFSREHEDQSDEEGQRWAAAAGFDPDGANRLFALMRARIPRVQAVRLLAHPSVLRGAGAQRSRRGRSSSSRTTHRPTPTFSAPAPRPPCSPGCAASPSPARTATTRRPAASRATPPASSRTRRSPPGRRARRRSASGCRSSTASARRSCRVPTSSATTAAWCAPTSSRRPRWLR